MANLFVNGLKTEENKTYTTNGCQALKSTNNSLLDLFGSFAPRQGDNVAHWAHLGGALAGLVLVIFWNRKSRRHFY